MVKMKELETKREKLLTQLPTAKITTKFAHVSYLDVRKSPIALVALTDPDEISDPYQFEPKFFIHKKMITMREKTNKWNGSFYEQFRYDFLEDKEDLPGKLVEDIKFNLLLKIVDNFCYEEYGKYYLENTLSQSIPLFRLSDKRCHTFNIAAIVIKERFLVNFIFKLAEFIFTIIENSSLFSPSNTKEKPEDSRIAVSLSDCSNFKIEFEYSVKGAPKSMKIIEVENYHSYFENADSHNDFLNFIRIDNKATLTLKIKASKSHLLSDQQYEVRFVFQIYPPDTDEASIRPSESPLGFVLFQDEALQLIDVPPELKYKQLRSRLKLFKTLSQ